MVVFVLLIMTLIAAAEAIHHKGRNRARDGSSMMMSIAHAFNVQQERKTIGK
jgi:hypothetical protein